MATFTDPRKFLYRDGALDPDEAKRLAARHLAHCDDGELYLGGSAGPQHVLRLELATGEGG